MSAVGKLLAGIGIIAVAIIAAPFTGGLSLNLIPIGTALVVQGIVGIIAGKPKTNLEAGKVNVRVGEPVRWLATGRVRQGGAVLFGEFDSIGNLWYVVVHSDSILVEKQQVILDDIVVTLDGAGNVTTDDFCLTKKKDPYEGSGTRETYWQIWTTTHSETDPTPPGIAALQSAGVGWSSDHKLVGTTYSVIKGRAIDIEHRYKAYKWRGPLGMGEPSIGIVGVWSNHYDPRDSGQTNGVPATYEPSRNPVLAWAWFRTHSYGRNKTRDSINWERVAEQAAICDQIVTGIEGDHVRYQCDAAIPEDQERAQAEQNILLTMDAQLIFDDDGKCWPRVGYYHTPTVTLTRNRDIIAMESIEAQNGESETHGVIVRYTDPDAKYIGQPAAAWYNPLYYVEGQSPKFLTIDILNCQDHNQAMRLAKAIGMRSQPLYKIAPTTGLRALMARQSRVIGINYDNTFAGDHEIFTNVEIDENGYFCTMALVPVDPDRWSLLPGEEKPKPVFEADSGLPPISLPTGVTVAFVNNRIEAEFDIPIREDVYYEFQFIRAPDIASDAWLAMSTDMVELFAYSGTVNTSEAYKVRWRSVAGSGRSSPWSAIYDLNATATPAPNPPTLYVDSATGGVAKITIKYRNPPDVDFDFVRYYRNTVNNYSTATAINDVVGSPSALVVFDDTPLAVGTYYYWFTSHRRVTGDASVTVGPISAVVT